METETKIKTPKSVIIFSNGNVACFDNSGEQIGELQEKGTIQLYLEWLESKGIDPTQIEKIETTVNGVYKYLKPFKTENGWNYEFINK